MGGGEWCAREEESVFSHKLTAVYERRLVCVSDGEWSVLGGGE